jgi:hypothetical protein
MTDAYKQCSVCGRKSWDEPEVQALCWMTQPNGSKCQGVLRLSTPKASQDVRNRVHQNCSTCTCEEPRE